MMGFTWMVAPVWITFVLAPMALQPPGLRAIPIPQPFASLVPGIII